jgi:DNA-binding MarR family transcriptional regulator
MLQLAASRLRTALSRRFRAAGQDRTPEHFGLLATLRHCEGCHQRELAGRLERDMPSLTRILDRLEAEGLTRREPDADDRRSHRLHLTDEGKATLDALEPIAREHLDDAFGAVGANDYAAFMRVLGHLAGHLDAFLNASEEDAGARPDASARERH